MAPTTETTEQSALSPAALRLAEGVELLGRLEGSGLREAPYLVRRPDGQVVQLSRLLYGIARHAQPGTDLAAIATRAGADLDVRMEPEHVRYVLEEKLQPLGVVADREGAPPAPRRIDPILALKFRVGVVPPALVGRAAAVLAPLFHGPVVLAVVGVLAVFDAWMVLSGGIGEGLTRVIDTPVLTLLLFGLAYVSLAWHELGHAAACRFGGARPGAIGVGLYIVWPVMYTDVTESYRFDRRGRLRVDLGGIYFNLLFALATGAAYVLTGFAPLLLVVVAQHLMILDQFVPWIRLDGYYVVSDLIGVSDLYTRIVPVLRSLVRPRREPDPRVAELRPWALGAVTAWVLTTIVVLLGGLAVLVIHAPAYVGRAWQSLLAQGSALGDGSLVEALAAGVGIVTLLLPVLAVVVSYALLCGGAGQRLALARTTARLRQGI